MKTLADAREQLARESWDQARIQLRYFVVAGVRPPMPLHIAARPFEELTMYQRIAIAQSAYRLVESAGSLTALAREDA